MICRDHDLEPRSDFAVGDTIYTDGKAARIVRLSARVATVKVNGVGLRASRKVAAAPRRCLRPRAGFFTSHQEVPNEIEISVVCKVCGDEFQRRSRLVRPRRLANLPALPG